MTISATTTPTCLAELRDRKIAHRSLGLGIPGLSGVGRSTGMRELGREFAEDRFGAREKQTGSGMPTLVVSGDHGHNNRSCRS
jgi:hypothetical protein